MKLKSSSVYGTDLNRYQTLKLETILSGFLYVLWYLHLNSEPPYGFAIAIDTVKKFINGEYGLQ